MKFFHVRSEMRNKKGDITSQIASTQALGDMVSTEKTIKALNNALNDKMLTSVIHVSDLLTNSRNIGLPSPSAAVNITHDPGWNFIEEEINNYGDVDLEKILLQIDDELQNSEELLEMYYPGANN